MQIAAKNLPQLPLANAFGTVRIISMPPIKEGQKLQDFSEMPRAQSHQTTSRSRGFSLPGIFNQSNKRGYNFFQGEGQDCLLDGKTRTRPRTPSRVKGAITRYTEKTSARWNDLIHYFGIEVVSNNNISNLNI